MNIALSIMKIYPDAQPNVHFVVLDEGNGPFIASWKYNQPQPTQQQLEAAWDLIKDIPVQPSIESRLQATEEALTALLGI